MGLQDILVTPIYLILFTVGAYFVRPFVTNRTTRKYFLPALWVRFIGAISLGLIYQFYYGGGDTFGYWEHGSRWIWKALLNDPVLGIKLLLEEGGTRRAAETYSYSKYIWYYRDTHSFLIVKLVSIVDLLTFHTYSASALFFAIFSFSGLWALFTAVTKKYKRNVKKLAIAVLFIPTTVLWGSGILKDTITLGSIAWLTYGLINLIEFRRFSVQYLLIVILFSWLVFLIKPYIIISYIPLISFWLFFKTQNKIRDRFLKVILGPIMLVIFLTIGYIGLLRVSEGSDKYSVDKIAERSAITAYDIRYGWGARSGGDGGYDLGELDGSVGSMISLMPSGIVVSLFRPFLWEVKNPFMLLSAIESLLFLLFTLKYVILEKGIFKIYRDPFLSFCLLFSLLFAFAVGVSTYNFGTLSRYRIPMIPLYAVLLVVVSTSPRNSVTTK